MSYVEQAHTIEDKSYCLVLPPVLALELLFKLLYLDDIGHIRYEIGERLTSFDVDIFMSKLTKAVP